MNILDDVAEMLLKALAQPIPASAPGFVFRVVKPGSALHREETLVRAKTRDEANALASEKARRWECRLRFVREQKGV